MMRGRNINPKKEIDYVAPPPNPPPDLQRKWTERPMPQLSGDKRVRERKKESASGEEQVGRCSGGGQRRGGSSLYWKPIGVHVQGAWRRDSRQAVGDVKLWVNEHAPQQKAVGAELGWEALGEENGQCAGMAPVPRAMDHTHASPFLPVYPWIDRTASEPIKSVLPPSTLDSRCTPLPEAACAMSDAQGSNAFCHPSPSFLPIHSRRATGAASGRQRTTHEGPRLCLASVTVAHRAGDLAFGPAASPVLPAVAERSSRLVDRNKGFTGGVLALEYSSHWPRRRWWFVDGPMADVPYAKRRDRGKGGVDERSIPPFHTAQTTHMMRMHTTHAQAERT
ncbi:hypothetical protein B0H13DRAFT_2569796 [Mycena leptocephala]|nr:hypothetical protein B0H13DRAFT_2569796 [Mycena leptocephala]